MLHGCRVSVLRGERVLEMVTQQCEYIMLKTSELHKKMVKMVNFVMCILPQLHLKIEMVQRIYSRDLGFQPRWRRR